MMADGKKIATRESYGNALVELGRAHDDVIVLDADLAGSTKTGTFRKAFPDRHINCGIAEADMVWCYAGQRWLGCLADEFVVVRSQHGDGLRDA